MPLPKPCPMNKEANNPPRARPVKGANHFLAPLNAAGCAAALVREKDCAPLGEEIFLCIPKLLPPPKRFACTSLIMNPKVNTVTIKSDRKVRIGVSPYIFIKVPDIIRINVYLIYQNFTK